MTRKPVNADWFVQQHTGMSIVTPAWKIEDMLVGRAPAWSASQELDESANTSKENRKNSR